MTKQFKQEMINLGIFIRTERKKQILTQKELSIKAFGNEYYTKTIRCF